MSNYANTYDEKGANPEVEAILNSGADMHFCLHQENFKTFITTPPCPVIAADRCTFYATGKGDITINLPNGHWTTQVMLKDIWYSPDLAFTLISVPTVVTPKLNIIGKIPLIGSLYQITEANSHHVNSAMKKVTLYEAH